MPTALCIPHAASRDPLFAETFDRRPFTATDELLAAAGFAGLIGLVLPAAKIAFGVMPWWLVLAPLVWAVPACIWLVAVGLLGRGR